MPDDRPTRSSALKQLRESLKLTQEQLAERTDGQLTRIDIVHLETGKNKGSTARVRTALAKALHLTLDQVAALLERGEMPDPDAPAVVADDRYDWGRVVVAQLVEDGYPADAARRAVGDVAFDEGKRFSDRFDLYRLAKATLDEERSGRPPVGARVIEEDDAPDAVEPPPKLPRRGGRKG